MSSTWNNIPKIKIWDQIGNDIDGEKIDDYSGASIELSSDGSVIAVGANANDGSYGRDLYPGHVRIYQNINNVWNQVGSDIDGESAKDMSGWSVSLSSDGSVVVIGAPYNDGENKENSGQVRIYQNINNVWNQVGSDIDGEGIGDESGWSVDLSADGSVVAIGAIGNRSDRGRVRIYQNNNDTWTQIGADIDGEGSFDIFGKSVAISSDGSVIAIGAYGNDDNGYNSGQQGFIRIITTLDSDWG